MKKRLLGVLLAVLMVLAVGCGKETKEVGNGFLGYPVTITDQAGREVTIEKEPESIACSYYIGTSMLMALGQSEKMVGVENTPEKRTIYGLAAKNLIDLPTLGTTKEFDLEKCATINPDLVVLPYKLKDVAASLEELGITSVVIQPESQNLLKECIAMLGKATGSTTRAKELNDFIDSKVEYLTGINSGVDRPSVFLSGNSDFLRTAGHGMYQNMLIENGGGENVAASIDDTYWAEISYEQLLAWDPDFIVLAAEAKYTVEDVLSDPVLKDMKAIKNGNVYRIPNFVEAWDSPVPSSILGCLWLESVLHEDKYSTEAYEKDALEFYENFYGIKIDFEINN